MKKVNMTKKFSDVKNSAKLLNMLKQSSRSKGDLDLRIAAHTKAFSNLEAHEGLVSTRKFATTGTTGLGQLSGLAPQQFIDVTISAMIKSIVSFFAVERGLEAPRAFLPFLNLVTVEEPEQMVSPNIGPDATFANGEWNYPIQTAQISQQSTWTDTISLASGKALVPGSVKIAAKKTVSAAEVSFTITDDCNGNLIAPTQADMKVGTVNYATGLINFQANAVVTGGTYVLDAAQDTPKQPSNRFKSDLDYYEMTTYPQNIIAETNSISTLVAQKSMGIDMNAVLKKKVMEQYLLLINRATINTILKGYTGDTVKVDLSRYDIRTNTFDSYLQLFQHGITQVNTALTTKSWKSVQTSAYLVGFRVAETFEACTQNNTFVPNKESAYIEDLIGYYNGIPVIRSQRVGAHEGYAIHKTSDGMMAPIARGIFLPINDLPEVGNFNNPTQSASGIFSHEGVKLIEPKLVQKFEVVFPLGLNTIETPSGLDSSTWGKQ